MRTSASYHQAWKSICVKQGCWTYFTEKIKWTIDQKMSLFKTHRRQKSREEIKRNRNGKGQACLNDSNDSDAATASDFVV